MYIIVTIIIINYSILYLYYLKCISLFTFIYVSIIQKSFYIIHIWYICYIIFFGYIIFFKALINQKYLVFYFDIISFISIICVSFSCLYIWINIIYNLISHYIIWLFISFHFTTFIIKNKHNNKLFIYYSHYSCIISLIINQI